MSSIGYQSHLSPSSVAVIDIETQVNPRIWNDPESRMLWIESLSPPKNYKDPDKIAQWKAIKIKEMERELALDPWAGKIVALGAAPLAGGNIECWADNDERTILTEFVRWWDTGPFYKLGGFSLRDFDVPFIIARLLAHGICPEKAIPAPRDWGGIIDPRDLVKKGSLKKWLHVCGLPGKTADGSDVADMSIDEVREYCANDVKVERLLLQRAFPFFPSVYQAKRREEFPVQGAPSA